MHDCIQNDSADQLRSNQILVEDPFQVTVNSPGPYISDPVPA
jgi:hypothetical protein